MREIRHYNLVFPLFITIFLPPYVIIPLVGNLLIDGMVYYLFLKQMDELPPVPKLMRLVVPAWVFGFIADIIGVGLLMAAAELLPLNIDLTGIWTNAATVIIVLFVISLVGYLIYLLNLWWLKHQGVDEEVSALVALAMGIVTTPWFFLIPATWFKALLAVV